MTLWNATLAGLGKGGWGLVFPEFCQLCRDESAKPGDGYIGDGCLAKLKPVEPPFCRRCGQLFPGEISGNFECTNCVETALRFEFARAVMQANAEMLDAIHRFKYQQALWLEPLFDRLFSAEAVNKSVIGVAIALCRCHFIRYGCASGDSIKPSNCAET